MNIHSFFDMKKETLKGFLEGLIKSGELWRVGARSQNRAEEAQGWG